MSVERCFICDNPTGRAGRTEDSIYDERGVGPFCETCWAERCRARALLIDRFAIAVIGGMYASLSAEAAWPESPTMRSYAKIAYAQAEEMLKARDATDGVAP